MFHSRGGPFQRLIDCAGIRYVLLLEFNKDDEKCFENTLLQRLYQGFEEEDITRCRTALFDVSKDFMKLFWPHLNHDIHIRTKNGTLMDPIRPLEYDRSDSHKLQLKTVNGSLRAVEHDTYLENLTKHFENPYPDVRCFQRTDIGILETITIKVFRVRILGEEYALKTGSHKLLPEIRRLRALPTHPNFLSLFGLLADARGKSMGMVTPFIQGKTLSIISSATMWQKEKWKTQISNAIQFLHEEGLIWGDAGTHNILINSATDEPVLIDLEPYEEVILAPENPVGIPLKFLRDSSA